MFLLPRLMNGSFGIGSFKAKNFYGCFSAGPCDGLKRQLYEYLGAQSECVRSLKLQCKKTWLTVGMKDGNRHLYYLNII